MHGLSVLVGFGPLHLRDSNGNRFAGKDLVIWIGNFDQKPVRARLESNHNNGIAACVGPGSGPIIDCHVKVAETRRDIDGALAEYGNDPNVFGPVLQDYDSPSQRLG